MSHVNDDAEPVHPPHGLGPEWGETAVDGRRGLDVAEFVDQQVRQLDAAHAARFHRVEAIEIAFQEIAALDRQHQRGVV